MGLMDLLTIKEKSEAVWEYFVTCPEAAQNALLILADVILAVAPNATLLMNYGIPAFALVPDGKRDQQIMIAGFAKHVGLYPHPEVMAHFESKLKAYKRGKGSVQFKLTDPIPTALVAEMVAYRVKMMENGGK
jgi:uncharacterized protein YdhG (YjbR/CyaY superfamily)